MRASRAIGETIQSIPRGEFVGLVPSGQRHVDTKRPLFREPSSMVVAAQLGAIDPDPSDRVLHLRSGTGYETALLANLFDSVVGVDREIAHVEGAREILALLGIDNAQFRVGNWREGLEFDGHFDAIYVSSLLAEIPDALIDTLAPGGRLVAPVRRRRRRADLVRLSRDPSGDGHRETLGVVDYQARLGDLLVDFGLLPRPYVEYLVEEAEKSGDRIGEMIVERGVLEPETVFHILSLQHGVEYGSVGSMLHGATTRFFDQLPERYMRHNNVVPVKRLGESVIAASTETHPPTGELRKVLGVPDVESYLVTPKAFRRIWKALDSGRIKERLTEEASPSVEPSEPPEPEVTEPVLEEEIDEELKNEYVELFDEIMFEAMAERASDIHLERYDSEDIRVRFRIDGDLRTMERFSLSDEEYNGLINVVKITANLDIAERRRPQGGRFSRRIDAEKVDMRVQIQPAMGGEFCVIRLLPQDEELTSIDELGFPSTIEDEYRRLVDSPNGLVLVVGPTGAGKSTTLYAGLRRLADDETKKLITVEDPIEYAIDGVEQTQTHEKIGFGFADAMRSFVRQDPDVILVGEIRDGETALEAIRASQTGHLVLSTLHCKDASDAIRRLMDLGMEPNSIASELVGVFAQRLAKRICTSCKREATPDPAIVDELFPNGAPEDFRAYEGTGCARCNGEGTRGRTVVVESLPVGPKLRRAISRELPLDDLRAVAVEEGITRLRKHGIDLVREGTIPLEELPRILSVEGMKPVERTGS